MLRIKTAYVNVIYDIKEFKILHYYSGYLTKFQMNM